MKKILECISNFVSPSYWAEKIGNKSWLYDKAKNSNLRKWVNNLDPTSWLVWQVVVGAILHQFINY